MILFNKIVTFIIAISSILFVDKTQASVQAATPVNVANTHQFDPIYFPSPFFHPVVREVTEAHLAHFIRDAHTMEREVRFLNAAQYNNIVRALEFRSVEFIQQGIGVIRSIANASLSTNFNTSWQNFLEENNLRGKKTWIYLKDAEGNPRTRTINGLALGIRTEDGQNLNWVIERNIPFSQLPRSIMDYIGHQMLYSFESVVDGFSKDYVFTLYLKDFSLEENSAFYIDSITIGIIVEDNNGQYIDNLDWLIARGISQSNLITTTYFIEEFVLTAIHEAAHVLISKVLDQVRPREYFSIVPQLLPRHREGEPTFWTYVMGVALADSSLPAPRPTTREQIIQYMATYLGGPIIEEMVFKDRFPDFYRDRLQNSALNDEQDALTRAYRGICMGLSSIENPNCPQELQKPLILWVNNLPDAQKSSFMQEARLWADEARHLARQILTRHASLLTELIHLSLLRETFDTEDIQTFYTDFPQSDISLAEIRNTSPQRYLDVLGDVFWTNMFHRVYSLSYSLNTNQWPTPNQGTSPKEILNELEGLEAHTEVPEEFLPYIRTNQVDADIEPIPNLPLFYFRSCVNILKGWYTMFTNSEDTED